jgi:hypothetical protein
VNSDHSEISDFGRKFIELPAIAHRQAAPGLGKIFDSNGGYILHLDAIRETQLPGTLSNNLIYQSHARYFLRLHVSFPILPQNVAHLQTFD